MGQELINSNHNKLKYKERVPGWASKLHLAYFWIGVILTINTPQVFLEYIQKLEYMNN